MEGHGIRIMAKVFGGMMNMISGDLVWPLKKEVQKDMLIWNIMEDVFQKFPIKNGNYMDLHPTLTTLLGMMLEKTLEFVAINQKVWIKK